MVYTGTSNKRCVGKWIAILKRRAQPGVVRTIYGTLFLIHARLLVDGKGMGSGIGQIWAKTQFLCLKICMTLSILLCLLVPVFLHL